VLFRSITGTLEPTHGAVHYEGRIAALLELGAGFNPEFTGIENIYLNGALMGFSRREIDERLAEIKRFAEIGDFVEQPVKTYSSGMYVRLAFAIAVSADPQILIVDEALAVGDAVFQQRCLRRIKEMQEGGATILFVSHDPHTIRALCTRAILFNAGRVEADGKPPEVLNRYQKSIMSRQAAYETSRLTASAEAGDEEELEVLEETFKPLSYTYRHGDGTAEILSIELLDAARRATEIIETGESVMVRVRIRFNAEENDPVFGFLIRDRHGIHIYGTNTEILQQYIGRVRCGQVVEVAFAFNCWLGVGEFSVTSAVHSASGISFDWVDNAVFFRVVSPINIEGVSNLNANVTTKRFALRTQQASAKV